MDHLGIKFHTSDNPTLTVARTQFAPGLCESSRGQSRPLLCAKQASGSPARTAMPALQAAEQKNEEKESKVPSV
jgi:hypothetical protein